MNKYTYNILLWLDEGCNVLIVPAFRKIVKLPPSAGNAHYTVSQTLAELRERKSAVGCLGCAILTLIQNKLFKKEGDHCTQAMEGMPENVNAG